MILRADGFRLTHPASLHLHYFQVKSFDLKAPPPSANEARVLRGGAAVDTRTRLVCYEVARPLTRERGPRRAVSAASAMRNAAKGTTYSGARYMRRLRNQAPLRLPEDNPYGSRADACTRSPDAAGTRLSRPGRPGLDSMDGTSLLPERHGWSIGAVPAGPGGHGSARTGEGRPRGKMLARHDHRIVVAGAPGNALNWAG